jgi:hypothetical protein
MVKVEILTAKLEEARLLPYRPLWAWQSCTTSALSGRNSAANLARRCYQRWFAPDDALNANITAFG